MADDRPETFGIRMARREKQLTQSHLRNVKRSMSAVLNTLVLTTRVDTGNARANWITTRTRPSRRIITNFPKGKKGSTAEAVAALTIARGQQAINELTPNNPGMWFVNNVPYIGIINDKYGDHMVERAIVAGSAALRNTRLFK